MIETLKQTIKEMYYWTKDKVIRFKKWLVILIFGAVVVAAPIISPSVPDIALQNIQADYEVSELKDKYRLEKTAFILDAVDENAIQAEVGNKNLDKFAPELTLRKWDDEVNFKVKYKHAEKEKDQKVDIENKKIKWKGKKTEVHYYDIKKGELLHDKVLEHDVYEVEVILLEKPDTNIVEFDIETKGLAFYYQPELTQEEIDEGAFRPENVIGSYAVYHESKQGDYSKMGLKNYRAGKAFHIYRPKIIDSAGTEVWGELNITDNLLTVTIPQEFLDIAIYPVRHAAGLTFGYEAVGGTSETYQVDDMFAYRFTSPADAGTADSVSIYTSDTSGSRYVKGIILLQSDKTIITNGIGDGVEAARPWYSPDFVASPFSTPPSLTPSTDYYLAVVANGAMFGKYDTGDANYSFEDTANSYASPENPGSVTEENHKYSIYCTYTAGGPEARRMFLIQ